MSARCSRWLLACAVVLFTGCPDPGGSEESEDADAGIPVTRHDGGNGSSSSSAEDAGTSSGAESSSSSAALSTSSSAGSSQESSSSAAASSTSLPVSSSSQAPSSTSFPVSSTSLPVSSSSASAASSSSAHADAGTPDAARPDAATPGPTCDDTAVVGDYCGGDKVASGAANTLYRCNGPGPATVRQACANGCVVAPSGEDDYCRPDTPTCDATAATGDYCGGDKVTHGDADTLYRCTGPGTAAVKQVCPGGCVVAPAGQDDYCRSVQPSCDANAATGEYCGGDKVSHADPDTLYHCNGPGPATVVQACAQGCVVAPAGQDDFCQASSPTCDATAATGAYCGGDKVDHANANTLYHCSGPGPASVLEACAGGCVIAAAGQDDYCASSCGHAGLLAWGLSPDASDHLRCAGVSADDISQTIGNAAASAGTHLQDGTLNGQPYCAATDLSVSGMTDTEVRALLSRLATQGFAAFYRKPGYDGWPSTGARHIHAIYAGVAMKASLRAQVEDWLNGLNGLASHTSYTFFQASSAQKNHVRALFNAAN